MLTPAHIDLYCRIKSSPYRNAGFRVDNALIYCEAVERRLEKLDEDQRLAIVLMGIGYTQAEIARLQHVSLRTMVRRMSHTNSALFAELIAVLGRPVAVKGGHSAGRPRKQAA